MRVIVIIPESEDFDRVVAEFSRFGTIYVKSKPRRFFAADEPPPRARDKLLKRGIEIVADKRYDME